MDINQKVGALNFDAKRKFKTKKLFKTKSFFGNGDMNDINLPPNYNINQRGQSMSMNNNT